MEIYSAAFSNNDQIPAKYTCDGDDISPPLAWKEVPEGTKSFVLIVDDPDAPGGTWTHWVLFNLPPTVTLLAENLSDLPLSTMVGRNSWGRNNYGGPCPPNAQHRYFFKLYALDSMLSLPFGSTKLELETRMMGHILTEAILVGVYKR